MCLAQEVIQMSTGGDRRPLPEQIREQVENYRREQQERTDKARDDTDRIIRDVEDKLDDWEPKR